VNAADTNRVLHRLFLTLFFRGRSSRGLKKQTPVVSIATKLRVILILYAALGLSVAVLWRQSIFVLSSYLHALTFMFVGMSIATSAGEMLFNDEEADILLHRPVPERALLWTKVSVLLRVSLWLAVAFNLTGFVVGTISPQGSVWFPVAHAASTSLEALFCAGMTVLAYELCLRWLGRERLEGLLTTVQVILSVSIVLGSQILPRLMSNLTQMHLDLHGWLLYVLPPAWFAGFDDAWAGTHTTLSLALAAVSVVATGVVMWLAFGVLADDYGTGLQLMNEAAPRPRSLAGRARLAGGRTLDKLVALPPLSWWLRDPVERASFLLSLAYLTRDRDCKLRVYPGLAPYLIAPAGIFLHRGGVDVTYFLAFAGSFLAQGTMLLLHMLRVSQDWAATDVFRLAPIAGPAPLCNGARKATLVLFAVPLAVVAAVAVWLDHGDPGRLVLLLPGVIAMPVISWIPCRKGLAVPLSSPPTGGPRAARSGLSYMGIMLGTLVLVFASVMVWQAGWLGWFLAVELVVAVILVMLMRWQAQAARWPVID